MINMKNTIDDLEKSNLELNGKDTIVSVLITLDNNHATKNQDL